MDDAELDQLPYRAEYAKSGRSNCKCCKTNIDKGSLRLAVMVQSPIFDAKIPNWYHVDCFFTRQRPKWADDIAHLDSLRWKDQETIKEKVFNTPAVILGAASKKGKKPSKKAVKSALKDFFLEYAKSSRTACRGCEFKIVKGTIRISKKDYQSDQAKCNGGQDRWYHIECFTKLRVELEFFESAENLPGFESLKAEGKKTVKEQLPKIDPPAFSEDVTDGAPSVKKVRPESVETKSENDEKKRQNEEMFYYRDFLKGLMQLHLTRLLFFNGQEDAVGVDRKLDRLSDLMTFGSLQPCEVCGKGQLVYRTGVGYQCTGNFNEWTKCTNVMIEPKRRLFKVPEDLADKYAFLDRYEGKIQKRLFTVGRSSTNNLNVASGSGAKVHRFAPLKDLTFFIVRKTSKPKAELKQLIENWGGIVASKLSKSVVAVISNKPSPSAIKTIDEAQQLNIPIIHDTYLEEVGKGGNAVEKITDFSISCWGGDPKALVQKIRQKSQMKKSLKSRFGLKNSSKVTLKVKGGTAVDPDSRLENVAHVYSSGKTIWNAVLGLTDIQTNKNSYFKLQLLASDDIKKCCSSPRYWVFRSWGRIGTRIGGHKTESMESLESAKTEFKDLYFEKTNNHWDKRHNFVKYSDFMHPIDVDYGESTIALSKNSSIPSKLTEPVQDLVAMLFDVDNMKKVMIEFELDMDKMPLGQLSKSQIQKAFSVLANLLENPSWETNPHAVIEATNRFYTLIPHSLGTEAPTPLSNMGIIREKLEMLESLKEMEVAYSLLRETKGEGDDNMHPLDAHYAKLNTQIHVLDRSSDEFRLIETYVKNTHGKTHATYCLEIEDAFKIQRNGENERYEPFKTFHNRKLLWHGSRTTNFAGILSQGLRIAPPEAPVTGYMFGKGIYFADMVSKSANYCMTSPKNPIGLLLLCEVALGDMYSRSQAHYLTVLPPGKHSTMGIGANFPEPKERKVIEGGLEIPLGHPKYLDSGGSLIYNEYIVYDAAQVKVRYLIKTRFVYNTDGE